MNKLSGEVSPYLLQHASNPVDWQPWSDEAFELAKGADRPVLLSIGYSACHWCHVMAHESFEDPATAKVMNELFVCIKVDREERPDVDAIYMEALQALTGRGGWPMTMFLTPDAKPFYGGTYFPPTARGGLPSFISLMNSVHDAWIGSREEVYSQAELLTEAIAGASNELAQPISTGGIEYPLQELARTSHAALRSWASKAWDSGWGGFGHEPKFPQCAVIESMIRSWWWDRSDDEAFAIFSTTLAGMAAGGIYDHVGGGFSRYSTDERWLVPHYEKMLYDQASLARVYLHGWQVTGDQRWRQVLDETIRYVLRDLAFDNGALASAEDADSEGEEGRFYLWRVKELKEILDDHFAEALMDWYSLTWKGNLGDGNNVPHRAPGAALKRPELVEEARVQLFEEREKRIRPGLDDKVITEWNAMFLSTLAEAAAATGDHVWHRSAVALGEFLYQNLRRPADSRWMRCWHASRGAYNLGFSSDHAWVVEAFTRLGELTGKALWISRASECADQLIELFWDEGDAGFFTSGSDADTLIVRAKEHFDGSTPSSNSIAAFALWRLGSILANSKYLAIAKAVCSSLGSRLEEHPAGHANMINALDAVKRPAVEIVITGDRPDLVEVAHREYLPYAVLAWGEAFDSPLWEGRVMEHSDVPASQANQGFAGKAFVCENYSCLVPTGDVAELAKQLGLASFQQQ